jgi:hypothetical protein
VKWYSGSGVRAISVPAAPQQPAAVSPAPRRAEALTAALAGADSGARGR